MPAVRLLSAQQLFAMICSALFLVKVPLCEQQTFTSKLAVTQACYLLSALFCTAALISERCILP